MKKFHLTAVIWKEEAGFVSKCPELGVASAGDGPQDALKNLKEAVELYSDNVKELDMLEDVHEAPESSEKFTSSLKVATI